VSVELLTGPMDRRRHGSKLSEMSTAKTAAVGGDDGYGLAVERAAALAVLGVVEGASWAEVRARYLVLVREHHPDAADDLADVGRRTVVTAQITEAYAALLAARDRAAPMAGASPGARPAPWTFQDARDDSRRVLLDAPFADAFLALLEVAHLVGDVSYIDRSSGVLEVIVTPEPARATSLLVYLEPGDAGVTEAVLGVESLGGHPPAALDPLVDRIAILLATQRPPPETPGR
jgi:hypothetical protein